MYQYMVASPHGEHDGPHLCYSINELTRSLADRILQDIRESGGFADDLSIEWAVMELAREAEANGNAMFTTTSGSIYELIYG